MKKLEIYDGSKTYCFVTGKLATPEVMYAEYPACRAFTYVVETDESGETILGFDSLAKLRSMHNIDSSLSNVEAIMALEDILNAPPAADSTPTPEERIAAALELQNLTSMEDITL